MSSFVGDLWKKVGELKLSVNTRTSSSFPFVYDEEKVIGAVGPFKIFQGQDYESSDRKEDSIFRRVNVFSCKEKNRIEGAKRILKSVKTMRHPRMLRYIFSKESENEVLMVTEWAEAFSTKPDGEWQNWAKWSVQQVYEFLKGAGREISVSADSGNLWITASGEVKVALFTEDSGEDVQSVLRRTFPDANSNAKELIQLTETFDLLVTLSAGERVSLMKKLSSSQQIRPDFLKFLALPEVVKSRKLLSPASQGQQEISLEEVHFIFVKGKELIKNTDDFMFLLSDLFCELLGKHANNPIPLTICLLDLIGNQGLCELFSEKYAQDKIYPHVSVLLGHPLAGIREIALKALQGLCEKLSAKTIGNDVLRQLARLQGDPEGSLRLKALGVLSGSVWSKIPDTLKAKICGPAVSRALADTFPPCRRSGLQLLRQGLALLPPQEIATKLIPAVALLLIEEDPGIRGEAFACLEGLILPTLKKNIIIKTQSQSIGSDDAVKTKTPEIRSIETGNNMKKEEIISVNSTSDVTNTTNNINFTSNIPKTPSASATTGSKMKLGSIKKIV